MSSKVPNPHDALFRSTLNNMEVAKDFFTAHLPPAVLNKINFDTLKLCNTSFLDEELKEQCSDVLYYSKSEKDSGNYIYILAEHQSSPAKLMPLRILKYQLAIITKHLQEHQNTTILPVVFPLVFYQQQKNRKSYPYSLNIFDLFHDQELARQTIAQPIHLVDITQFSDDDLRKHKLVGLMEYLQKHAKDRDLLLVIQELKQFILDTLQEIGNNEILLVNYVESCLYYIMTVGNVSNPEELIRELKTIPVVKEKIVGTLARKFQEEGKAEGIVEGIVKGKAEGIVEGIVKGKAEGIVEGIVKGKAEGIVEGKKETALSMKKRGLDIKLISDVTNLPIEEIQKLS